MVQLLDYAMMLTVPWVLWRHFSLWQGVKTTDSWPCIDGEIISSSIGTSSGTYNNPNTLYQTKITYQYEVGGRQRNNNKICVGGQLQLYLRSKANEYLVRYPEGK